MNRRLVAWRHAVLHAACALLPLCAAAADAGPWNAWVPAGWKLVTSASGDLNADGQPDAVLLLQQQDPALLKANEGLGPKQIDENPRRLLVLFKSAGGYREVLRRDDFLPSAGDTGQPCLADPLDNGSLQVDRGALLIALQHWSSCGSWGMSRMQMRFRHEAAHAGGRFRLIGYEHVESSRNTGDETRYSYNYLTGRKSVTRVLNGGADGPPPKATWSRMAHQRPVYLDDMSPSCSVEEASPTNWCH